MFSGEELPSDAVRLVFALAFFVLHDAALEVEFFLVEDAEQMAHAVAFSEEHVVEHGGGNIFEIIGAVVVGGAVQIGGADALHGVDVSEIEIVAAAEHEVLEEVGEAGFRPAFSFFEPTWYQMLTATMGALWSS